MTTRTKCPKCGYERTTEDDETTPPEQCPSCGVIYEKFAHPSVGRPKARLTNRTASGLAPFTMLNLGLSVAGAALLALGAFLPVFSFGPMSITYFKGGDGDGVFIVIAAAVILIGALAKQRRIVGYAGIASIALIIFGIYHLSSKLNEGKAEMAKELEGNPFAGLAMSVSESASMEWGWAVMIVGALLATTGAFISEKWLKERYGS